MNQTCKVCGEPAAGFHFGAFTCEGCKSFFGRSYNNLSSISECKNNGKCIIDKKNRTTCKACRLRKCYTVGMSKGGSRYGRRSNWFKIHCLLQEQQQQAVEAAGQAGVMSTNSPNAPHGFGADMAAAAAAAAAHQQRSSAPHMQAQHIGGLLGYPTYLPDMAAAAAAAAAGSPFARHPADAAAAAAASALPFFSMMNSMPTIGSHTQSAFQLPSHLLFPGYHHPAAAAAAADAAYRSEMYKHRQSVDSAASGESQRYTPTRTLSRTDEERVPSLASASASASALSSACQSPVEVVVDEDRHSVHSHQSHHSNISPVIHNPIAIRATPTEQQQPHLPQQPQPQQQKEQISHSPLQHQQQLSNPHPTPEPLATTPTTAATSPALLSFTAKMESLSPVSICSIGHETFSPTLETRANDQDCPMDLSMKNSHSSVHSFITSTAEYDAHSDLSSSEELCVEVRAESRRKYYQINSESSEATNSSLEHKRQKLALDEAAAAATDAYASFGSTHSANAMRGIFVCV